MWIPYRGTLINIVPGGAHGTIVSGTPTYEQYVELCYEIGAIPILRLCWYIKAWTRLWWAAAVRWMRGTKNE